MLRISVDRSYGVLVRKKHAPLLVAQPKTQIAKATMLLLGAASNEHLWYWRRRFSCEIPLLYYYNAEENISLVSSRTPSSRIKL